MSKLRSIVWSGVPRLNFDTCLLIAPVVYRGRAYPCAGLGYLASYLEAMKVDVRVVDTNFTGEDADEALRDTPPCVVGITCESRNVKEALRLSRVAKAYGHITVLGGLHVSLVKAEMLCDSSVDYAIHGDGEEALYELIVALKTGGPLGAVSGLIYREPQPTEGSSQARVLVSPPARLSDVNLLPFPAYDLAGIDEIVEYPLITSRGCPYTCTFCTVGTIAQRGWWQRDAGDLIDELLHARRRYNIKGFFVGDEMFSLDLERVKLFCRMLIEKKNSMPWAIMEGLRADRVDSELLDLLLASGCGWVVFGIESFDRDVFEGITKGEEIEKIYRAIQLCQDHGMSVGGYFVIGLPGATFARDMETLSVAEDVGLEYGAFWMANPYLGTPMYDWVLENGTLLRSPTGDNIVNSLSTEPLFETPDYSAHERKKAHAIANLRMGFRTFYDEPVPDSPEARGRHLQRLTEMIALYDPTRMAQYLDPAEAPVDIRPGWRNWMTQRRPIAISRFRGVVVEGR